MRSSEFGVRSWVCGASRGKWRRGLFECGTADGERRENINKINIFNAGGGKDARAEGWETWTSPRPPRCPRAALKVRFLQHFQHYQHGCGEEGTIGVWEVGPQITQRARMGSRFGRTQPGRGRRSRTPQAGGGGTTRCRGDREAAEVSVFASPRHAWDTVGGDGEMSMFGRTFVDVSGDRLISLLND
jgi:hypothetical protein